MTSPPEPPDPSALTQPIPIVVPQPPPPPRPYVQAYAHRFGNVPLYLLGRFAAFAVDLFGVAFVLTAFGFNAFDRGVQTFAGRDQYGFSLLGGGSLGVAFLFAFLCEALTGTTLGKMTFALHTRRVDGGHAGGGRVLLRYLLLPVDLLAIGPILALATRRHQRLGDLLAGTVVSGSRIGFFAPILGLAVIAGIGYADIVYGGGVSSGIEVAAEASTVLPGFVTKVAQAVGLGAVHLPPVSQKPLTEPPAFATATPAATAAATAAPLVAPSSEPSLMPSADASSEPMMDTTAAPEGTASEAPGDATTQDPGTQPTDRVITQ